MRFPTKVTFDSEVEGVITDDSDVTPESIETIVPLPAPTSLVKSRRACLQLRPSLSDRKSVV